MHKLTVLLNHSLSMFDLYMYLSSNKYMIKKTMNTKFEIDSLIAHKDNNIIECYLK